MAKSLRRKVGSCAGSRCVYDEAVYVRLTREQVERAGTDGFRARWNPQHGASIETTIPAAYFAAIVAASNSAPGGKDGATVDERKTGDVSATSSSAPALAVVESEKRRVEQAMIEPPVQDAATRSAFLRMAPSLTPHSGGVYWIGSIEPSSDNQRPSAAVLGVACKGGGKFVFSVGTQIPIKKTWSIAPPLTDVRYYFDDDETHRNWEQFGPSEAGPMTGLGAAGATAPIEATAAARIEQSDGPGVWTRPGTSGYV